MNRQEDVDMHGYRILWWSLCVLLWLAPSAQGQTRATDTIRMKNGSILHGVVARFENGLFTVIIPGTQSRAMVHVDDVEQIEFAAERSAAASPTPVRPSPEPRMERATDVTGNTPSALTQDQQRSPSPSSSGRAAESTQMASMQERGGKTDVVREPATSTPGKPPTGSTEPSKSATATANPSAGNPPATASPSVVNPPATAQPTGSKPGAGQTTPANGPALLSTSPRPPAVRELTVRVAGNEVWVDSGLDVRQGDTIRLSASGRVQLSRTQATGPEGVNIADPQKMMPNRPTGGLIAVIGDDNDDFIFIGAGAQLQARRSGRLFLMVNENVLEDNSGAFTVRIQAQSAAEPNRE